MPDRYGALKVVQADGAYVWDDHGRRYLDYRQSGGASILGHAAVGSTAAPPASAADLSSLIVERVPGCGAVQLVDSLESGRQLAFEIARTVTGRPDVVSAPIRHLGDSVAAVVVQPLAPSVAGVGLDYAQLALIAQSCAANGSLLIFDEASSGFRVAAGGVTEMSGVVPDLWCWGKVLEAGGTLGALGATVKLTSVLDEYPRSEIPEAVAGAAVAVLRRLDGPAYKMLTGRAEELVKPLRKAMDDAGLPSQVSQYGPVLALQFLSDGSTDKGNEDPYCVFVAAMADRSILVPTQSGQPFFPSLAHAWDDIERTADTFAAAAAVVAAAIAVER